MSKTALLLGLVVALSGTTLYLRQEIKTGLEQQAELEQQIEDLGERLRIAEMRPEPGEVSDPVAVLPATEATNPSPPAAVTASPPQPLSPPPLSFRNEGLRNAMERQAQLFKDPEYRAAMKMQQKMGLARAYTDLASALNLRPEEADRLLDLLAEQQLQSTETSQAMRVGFDRSNPGAMEEFRQRMEQDQARKDMEVAQLIGDSGLQAWKDYQSSLGARFQVRELRTFLEGSTAPLREDQFQPLVNAIAGEQRKQQEEMQDAAYINSSQPAPALARFGSSMETNVERLERTNQRLHNAAAPHLSSEQLNRFDQMLNQQLVMARANLKMMQAQGVNQGVMAGEPISSVPSGVVSSSSGVIVAQ